MTTDKTPTRVLHVIGSLGCGGAQVVLKHIVENCDDNEVKSFVYPLRSAQRRILVKSNVITRSYPNYDPRKFFTILRLCKQYEIDILVAHLSKPIIACLLAAFFCKCKLIIYEHGPIFETGPQYTLYRLILRLLWRRAAAFVAVSNYIADYLQRRIGIPPDRIKVINNAVNLEQFSPHRIPPKKIRAKLGIADSDIIVGYVGRLDYLKGPDLLVEAAASLLRKSQRYLFLFVGDGPLRNKLEQSAQQLGIHDRIKFLGFREDVPEIMSTFDLAVVPSRRESFGIACLELMSMRIPVISSGAGGMSEYITNEQTGLLLKENTPDEICRAVEQLTDDRQLRQQLIEAGSKLVQRFGIEEYARKTRQIYEELLPKHH
ncbi:MAG: glycosyltransferase family 4 protein [Sedimentisphaerales bacterium]|nr:glycosyltransferase family 4 protein [Sedimentisphaerales bacterium]